MEKAQPVLSRVGAVPTRAPPAAGDFIEAGEAGERFQEDKAGTRKAGIAFAHVNAHKVLVHHRASGIILFLAAMFFQVE